MQPSSQRRVHGAEFKAQVLAECQRPGASVAAVSLAHGLNVNLVRKWLVGRGLKRCGLLAPRTVKRLPPGEAGTAATPLQFVPVALAAARSADAEAVGAVAAEPSAGAAAHTEQIHIELRRGNAHLTVRWPASQAQACAAWLRELGATALK